MQVGKASLRFEHPAFVASWASVAGKKEGQGPLADGIDVTETDEMFGMENWEQAESAMQKQAADLALEKGNIHRREVRYLFAGDRKEPICEVEVELLYGDAGSLPPLCNQLISEYGLYEEKRSKYQRARALAEAEETE